ncbi:hypothetical protein RUND412_000918 [Rhizina undulata]
MAQIIADKTPLLTSFLLPLLDTHVSSNSSATSPPFFLGISGPQGSGKTTLVTTLAETLRLPPHNLNVVVFSIDDIYLDHTSQNSLRELFPDNKLVSHRGEPGTHDVELGKRVFDSLREQRETRVPAYDKSAFSGRGNRVDEGLWESFSGPYDVVIFEGWCVGFRPLDAKVLEEKWRVSRETGRGTLGRHELEHVLFVNTKLRGYDALTDSLDALVHIDAEDISYVYDWRLQQEHDLIAAKGTGMTDDQVVAFVDGYMPAYELYVESLREGAIKEKGKKLRVVIGKDRNVSKLVNL